MYSDYSTRPPLILAVVWAISMSSSVLLRYCYTESYLNRHVRNSHDLAGHVFYLNGYCDYNPGDTCIIFNFNTRKKYLILMAYKEFSFFSIGHVLYLNLL